MFVQSGLITSLYYPRKLVGAIRDIVLHNGIFQEGETEMEALRARVQHAEAEAAVSMELLREREKELDQIKSSLAAKPAKEDDRTWSTALMTVKGPARIEKKDATLSTKLGAKDGDEGEPFGGAVKEEKLADDDEEEEVSIATVGQKLKRWVAVET